MPGVWDGCAPPPARRSTERDIDPRRNTVPRAEDHYIVSYSDEDGLTQRPAKQSDLKHCASCTCPPEEPSTPPASTGGENDA